MVKISAVVFIPILKANEPDNSLSNLEYSSDLTISVLDKYGNLVGDCDPLSDPFSQSESDCSELRGAKILITRTCSSCKLGTCNIGIMTLNCGKCSETSLVEDDIHSDHWIANLFVDTTENYNIELSETLILDLNL